MSNYTTIRDEIKTILNTVTDIGTVIDWPKSSIDPDIFKQNYLNVDAEGVTEIRAWAIARRAVRIDYGADNSGSHGRYAKFNDISIFGLMSVDDERATWDTFNDLIDAVITAIIPQITLNGSVFVMRSPWTVTPIDQRDVGGRILHYVEIRGTTMEQVVATWV